jgi:signal transduction histidine kinase
MLLIKNQLVTSLRQKRIGEIHEQLGRMNDLTGETIQEIRNISHNLRPQHLDQLGLTTALETLVETVQENSAIQFHLHCDPINGLIPVEHEINFYRIVQEALNNILKHSGASEASIIVRHREKKIDLEIQDNGKGFSLKTLAGEKGMGLTGMQERARMFHATIEIFQAQPTGTIIHLQYNLP